MSNFFNDNQEPLTLENVEVKTSYNKNQYLLPGNKNRKTLLIALSLVILSLFIVYFLLQLADFVKSGDVAEEKSKGGEERTVVSYLDLSPMVVALLPSSNDRQNYLKLQITLQLKSDKDSKDIQEMFPVVLDTLQMFLKELRVIDLEGSGSSLYIKEELIKRINKITDPIVVDDVLIKEMLLS